MFLSCHHIFWIFSRSDISAKFAKTLLVCQRIKEILIGEIRSVVKDSLKTIFPEGKTANEKTLNLPSFFVPNMAVFTISPDSKAVERWNESNSNIYRENTAQFLRGNLRSFGVTFSQTELRKHYKQKERYFSSDFSDDSDSSKDFYREGRESSSEDLFNEIYKYFVFLLPHRIYNCFKFALETNPSQYFYDKLLQTQRIIEKMQRVAKNNLLYGQCSNWGPDNKSKEFDSERFKKLADFDVWFEVAENLFSFFMGFVENQKTSKINSEIESVIYTYLNPLEVYTKRICRQAAKKALDVYNRKRPIQYPFSYHLRKALSALKLYEEHSVGPRRYQQREALKLQMNVSWLSGKNICGALSLTSRVCRKTPFNKANPNFDLEKDSKTIEKVFQCPEGRHDSGFRTVHSCNCGEKVYERMDPYDLEEANNVCFDQKCCKSSYKSRVSLKNAFWSLVKLPLVNREDLRLYFWHKVENFDRQNSKTAFLVITSNKGNNDMKYKNASHVIDYSFEYECPKGHRFFQNSYSNSNEISLIPPKNVKLQVLCRVCNVTSRNRHKISASLQRFYFLIPKTNAKFTISPKISDESKVFYPFRKEIKLESNTFYVLRFPYVYTEKGIPVEKNNLELLKGALRYVYS